MSEPPASEFLITDRLSLCERWQFNRRLSAAQIQGDDISLQRLKQFEQSLAARYRSKPKIMHALIKALDWYRPVQIAGQRYDRSPERLQVALVFLKRSPSLNGQYIEMVNAIIEASDRFAAPEEGETGIGVDAFREEITGVVSLLQKDWSVFDSWVSGTGKKIAIRFAEMLPPACERSRLSAICHNIPAIGNVTVVSLLEIYRDFAAFETIFWRIDQVMKDLELPTNWFNPISSSFLGDPFISILVALARDPRLLQYENYHREFGPSARIKITTAQIAMAARNHSELWKADDIAGTIRRIISYCENFFAHKYLYSWWNNLYESLSYSSGCRLRWDFNKFTEYVPEENISLDWRLDNDQTRRFWDWSHVQKAESGKFIGTLEPRLAALFNVLTLSEMNELLGILPAHFRVQSFQQEIMIPAEWDVKEEYFDGYDHYIGYYYEWKRVGRPTKFAPHVFTFGRPDLTLAVDLLDHPDQVRALLASPERKTFLTQNRPSSMPHDLPESLPEVASYLWRSFAGRIAKIGLYGSW